MNKGLNDIEKGINAVYQDAEIDIVMASMIKELNKDCCVPIGNDFEIAKKYGLKANSKIVWLLALHEQIIKKNESNQLG